MSWTRTFTKTQAPASRHTRAARFDLRSPLLPEHLPLRKLHGDGPKNQVEGHTSSNDQNKAMGAKGDARKECGTVGHRNGNAPPWEHKERQPSHVFTRTRDGVEMNLTFAATLHRSRSNLRTSGLPHATHVLEPLAQRRPTHLGWAPRTTPPIKEPPHPRPTTVTCISHRLPHAEQSHHVTTLH